MYKGTVSFVAEITGNGLTFPRFDYDPNKPGVAKVEIEGLDGHVIGSTVYLSGVQSPESGITLAEQVNTASLDRIAFRENIAIGKARRGKEDFSPLDEQPGTRVIFAGTGRFEVKGSDVKIIVSRCPAQLREMLEKPTTPGDRSYGLFRSALQSTGPVEEFMHLYHILMVLIKDSQLNIDEYIISEEPAVPQTSSPWKPGLNETVYTRLRNEFAHKRGEDNLELTKAEMTKFLGKLRMLVRKAIEEESMSRTE